MLCSYSRSVDLQDQLNRLESLVNLLWLSACFETTSVKLGTLLTTVADGMRWICQMGWQSVLLEEPEMPAPQFPFFADTAQAVKHYFKEGWSGWDMLLSHSSMYLHPLPWATPLEHFFCLILADSFIPYEVGLRLSRAEAQGRQLGQSKSRQLRSYRRIVPTSLKCIS